MTLDMDRRPAETVSNDGRGPRENPLSVAAATLFMVIFAIYFLVPIWWLIVERE